MEIASGVVAGEDEMDAQRLLRYKRKHVTGKKICVAHLA